MSNLTPFAYADHEVRVITINGEPWFVLNDLCSVLDIANPRNASNRLAPDMKGVRRVDTPGGKQSLTVVSEAGMYEVVIRSDKPEAIAFRRWITSEVLPAIRKTGSYGTAPALTEDQIVRQALAITHRDLEAAKAQLELAAPKAAYVDTFVADEDLRILRNVAKSLGIQELALRNALLDHDWIYVEHTSRWSEKKRKKVPMRRYSPMADKRAYFRPVPRHEAPRFRGEVMHYLKVTPAGAVAIAKAAKRWGLAPEEAAA